LPRLPKGFQGVGDRGLLPHKIDIRGTLWTGAADSGSAPGERFGRDDGISHVVVRLWYEEMYRQT